MKRTMLAVALAASCAAAQAASDIDNLGNLGQAQFRLFSEDLGAALSYKALAPAEPLGITGFDIGIEATATRLEHSALFDEATTGSGMDYLVVPKLHVHKGLPFNIDVGGFYSSVPNTNIKLTGLELRYAFLEGGIAMPAVAVRAAYTKLSGVDQLDFDTRSVELTASKGFVMLTPYAGIGKVWTTSTPNGIASLQEESFALTKIFIGANLNLGLLNLAIEGDKTGDAASYGLKLGFRW